mmetsp:Transcript_21267/g.29780  ORF Transcript_21267/g.29780 Transcript_21267/m.29780 type:complete len:202 (+) Transcript_21267:32-637(+)
MSIPTQASTSVFRTLIAKYEHFLAIRPVITKVVTAVVIVTIGDVSAQYTFEREKTKREGYRLDRTIRMASLAAVFTPVLHKYFLVLDKYFPVHTFKDTLKKLAFDQLVWCPPSMAFNMAVISYLDLRDTRRVKEKMKTDFLPALQANYLLWPAANLINFQFVPGRHRILYVSIVGLFWNVYWCWVTNRDVPKADLLSHRST